MNKTVCTMISASSAIHYLEVYVMRPRLAVVLSTYRIVLHSPVLISPFKYIIANAFDTAITQRNRLSDVHF